MHANVASISGVQEDEPYAPGERMESSSEGIGGQVRHQTAGGSSFQDVPSLGQMQAVSGDTGHTSVRRAHEQYQSQVEDAGDRLFDFEDLYSGYADS